jgi:O-antigen/teichoic acid export membrane protein
MMKSLKDTLGLLATRVVWSAMGVVSGVILARWLGPHDRGVLALVLLLPSTIVTTVKFGAAQANVYTINRHKASVDAVASNALVLAIFWGVVSSLAVWAVRDRLTDSVLRDVPDWALVFALVRVPMLLLDNYLFSILQAIGKFSTYNIRLLLSESLRLVLLAIALIVFDMGLMAALVIYTLVWMVNVIWLVTAMSTRIRFRLSIDWPLLRETYSFGIRSYVQILTQHMLLRISFYMVSYYLGAASVAFYTIALRFTELVLEVPQAIGLVLYPRLASLDEDEIHRLTAQTCRRTLMITAPAAAALALIGPYVIVLWYGDDFAEATGPLPWAAIGVALMSIYVIVTRDFTSRAKQRINTVSGLVALASNAVLNVLLIPPLGIVGAAMATAFSYAAACVVLIVFFLRESGLTLSDLIIPTGEDIKYFIDVGTRLARRVPGAAKYLPAAAKKGTGSSEV